jgi:hypothetical protein
MASCGFLPKSSGSNQHHSKDLYAAGRCAEAHIFCLSELASDFNRNETSTDNDNDWTDLKYITGSIEVFLHPQFLLASLRSTYAWCRLNTFVVPFQIVRLHLAFALRNNCLFPWDQPALLSLQNQSVGCRLRHLNPSWSPRTFHSRSRVHRICINEANRAGVG